MRNLVLASGRTDGLEVKWLNEVYTGGSQFEDFNSWGDARFATLDIKLHSAITAIIKEGNRTLATKLASLEGAALDKGTILKGRQVVWLIHDWFRLNPDMKPLCGLQEITDLKWLGDDKIFEFLELLRQIVENNSIQLSEKQLAVILVEKPAASKVLAQDVALWRMLAENDGQKSYDYLMYTTQRHLERQQIDRNNSGR